MRCPKCSYISFDLLEKCVKCGKKISEAATDLQGTIASVPPPSFLRMTVEEAPPEAVEETTEFETEEPLDLGEVGEEETLDFSLEEGASAEASEVELDFGGEAAAEEPPEAEIDFGIEEEAEEETAIGISDLAPSEEAEEEVEVVAEEIEEVGAAAGEGLEDLEVEGIDLESAPGAADTDKITPSVKTGTALDDFDIDLGDLLTSKKD